MKKSSLSHFYFSIFFFIDFWPPAVFEEQKTYGETQTSHFQSTRVRSRTLLHHLSQHVFDSLYFSLSNIKIFCRIKFLSVLLIFDKFHYSTLSADHFEFYFNEPLFFFFTNLVIKKTKQNKQKKCVCVSFYWEAYSLTYTFL